MGWLMIRIGHNHVCALAELKPSEVEAIEGEACRVPAEYTLEAAPHLEVRGGGEFSPGDQSTIVLPARPLVFLPVRGLFSPSPTSGLGPSMKEQVSLSNASPCRP
jgi:hypothetical protein